MNNLEEKMQERLDAWRKNQHPDFVKAKQKLSIYQQQELELLKFEQDNNARHNKR